MYIPFQVNRFQKSILLIVQYKYSKSYSEDFFLKKSNENLILRTRSCGTALITQDSWLPHFRKAEIWNDLYHNCTSSEGASWRGQPLYIFTWSIFIPKLLLRLLWFFRRTSALFRQIRTFLQLFRFCSDLGNSGIRQIVRNSMLTGRWWEGRILINLCGNNNVRNCDLLQSDFFDRCRTVLGVAKGFSRRVWTVWWNLEKDEAPKRCDFLRWRNMLLKTTFKRSFWVLFGVTSAVTKKWLCLKIFKVWTD